ncbi:MAG: NAD-dependent epimerase/dehydratase family protein [Dehalococcoidia bacterium]
MARVLVTGGAGFIGSHTVERLLREGHAVTALDNLVSGAWENLAQARGDLTRVESDVCDANRLADLTLRGRFDAIVHLAAWASIIASVERPVEAHAANVGGTLAMLEAARLAGVRRVVFASSAAVYGRTPPLPTPEDSPYQPVSPYAAHKAEGELLCSAYRSAYGLETVILRCFNVYGSRQPHDSPYSGVVAVLLHRLAAGQTITVHGDGEQTRDFIHVSDVVEAMVRAALGSDPGPGAINVATGAGTSVLGLLTTVRAVLHADAAIVFGPARPGDVRHSRADIARLCERLGFTAQRDLAAGLRETIGITS